MMEWTEFHVSVTIVGLLKAGRSTAKIHMFLRLLKVNECRVYHVKKLFEETGDVCDCLQACRPLSTHKKCRECDIRLNHSKLLL